MNKRLFILLVVLMSISLIGIIFVQGYWIKQSVEDKEEQFSTMATEILNSVTSKIEKRELADYTNQLLRIKDSIGGQAKAPDLLKNLFFIERDLTSNEITYYSHGILEENYSVPSTFFDNSSIGSNRDSTLVKNITSIRNKAIFKEEFSLDGRALSLTPVQKLEKIGGLTSIEKALFEDVFKEKANIKPVHTRISKQEIELLLGQELKNRNIDTEYEYSVYSKGLPTKVKSRKFKFSKSKLYAYPIFKDLDGESNFTLLLTFPAKKKFLIKTILPMAILSLLFTLVILVAYTSAIYQLIRQKQISEIKSDFINNMTHEFKTPIATINLAVEAIKNPKIIDDKEKVHRYLDMAHVELIVADRGGYINLHLDSESSEILASEMHFTNVIVNMLDNAIKYSPEAPKIDVYTEVANNNVIIKIKDQGAGMGKAVLKKVFEKFYREHTGNIHNVKGHGLGLAYVKKIVEDHQGEVYVESEKGKGSTFYVKLPLI
jgi:two-component system phosphate regulon sensor histidine kinase PhoR